MLVRAFLRLISEHGLHAAVLGAASRDTVLLQGLVSLPRS